MAEFYVETQGTEADGNQVHLTTCGALPAQDGLYYIGSYASADAAVSIAKGYYKDVSVCPSCLQKAG